MSGAIKHTPGPWKVATSNSWRRVVDDRERSVCEPIKQRDGHPDLYFRNGGSDGPDARLITAAPDLLQSLWEIRSMFMDRPDMVRAIQPLLGPAEKSVFDRAARAIAKAEGRS